MYRVKFQAEAVVRIAREVAARAEVRERERAEAADVAP